MIGTPGNPRQGLTIFSREADQKRINVLNFVDEEDQGFGLEESVQAYSSPPASDPTGGMRRSSSSHREWLVISLFVSEEEPPVHSPALSFGIQVDVPCKVMDEAPWVDAEISPSVLVTPDFAWIVPIG
jgi:hypothetical protein